MAAGGKKSDAGRLAMREVAHVEKIDVETSEKRHRVSAIGDWTFSDGSPVTDEETIHRLEAKALLDATNGVVRALLNDDVKVQLTPVIEDILTRDIVTLSDFSHLEKYGFPALNIVAEQMDISTTEAFLHMERSGMPLPLFTVLVQEWAAHRNMIHTGE